VLRSKRIALNPAVVTVVAIRLFVASVMDRVGNSALNGLRKDLLDLLRNNGSVTTILGMCLRRRLVGLAPGGMNLRPLLIHHLQVVRYEQNIRSREEPPRGLMEPAPGPCWGQQSRQWRGTCPVHTSWWKTS